MKKQLNLNSEESNAQLEHDQPLAIPAENSLEPAPVLDLSEESLRKPFLESRFTIGLEGSAGIPDQLFSRFSSWVEVAFKPISMNIWQKICQKIFGSIGFLVGFIGTSYVMFALGAEFGDVLYEDLGFKHGWVKIALHYFFGVTTSFAMSALGATAGYDLFKACFGSAEIEINPLQRRCLRGLKYVLGFLGFCFAVFSAIPIAYLTYQNLEDSYLRFVITPFGFAAPLLFNFASEMRVCKKICQGGTDIGGKRAYLVEQLNQTIESVSIMPEIKFKEFKDDPRSWTLKILNPSAKDTTPLISTISKRNDSEKFWLALALIFGMAFGSAGTFVFFSLAEQAFDYADDNFHLPFGPDIKPYLKFCIALLAYIPNAILASERTHARFETLYHCRAERKFTPDSGWFIFMTALVFGLCASSSTVGQALKVAAAATGALKVLDSVLVLPTCIAPTSVRSKASEDLINRIRYTLCPPPRHKMLESIRKVKSKMPDLSNEVVDAVYEKLIVNHRGV